MAGIAVSAATGVMISLLSKLSLLLSDQYRQLKGVRRDIEFLNRELTDMNAALEKLAGMDKLDVQMKAWRDKVREMAYDIEDCIDIFMHQHGQGDDKDSLVNKTARKITKLRARYQIANKIQSSKLVLRSRVKAEIGTGYMNLSQSLEWWKLTQGCPRCLRMQKGLSALMVHSQKSSNCCWKVMVILDNLKWYPSWDLVVLARQHLQTRCMLKYRMSLTVRHSCQCLQVLTCQRF